MARGSPRGDQLRGTGGDPQKPASSKLEQATLAIARGDLKLLKRGLFHLELLFIALFFNEKRLRLKVKPARLKASPQRFYLAGQRLGLCLLKASSYLGQGKRLGPRNLQRDSDHVIGKCTRPTTVVTAHERANASNTPRVSPVVDSLVAHTEGFTDDLWLIPASEHQKTRGASARVLEPVMVLTKCRVKLVKAEEITLQEMAINLYQEHLHALTARAALPRHLTKACHRCGTLASGVDEFHSVKYLPQSEKLEHGLQTMP